jgi:hypothetical protein
MIILKMKNDKAADLLQYKPRCGRCFALWKGGLKI